MKKLLLLLIPFFNNGVAQENENAIAKAHYIFRHVNDTTQRDKYLRDEVVTYLGQSGSYYTSYSNARISEQMKKALSDPAFDGNLTLSRNTSAITDSYLLKPQEDLFKEIRSIAGDQYVLESAYPEQDWSIEDETRNIGGYTCQKATTTFKGRNYTAWFTTEIPFSYGPWKLHGLPGLIVEAYDNKKEVVFEYSGFDKELEGEPVLIGVSDKALQVSQKEFDKQQEAFKANPQAYMSAKVGSSGSITRVSGGAGGSTVAGSGGPTFMSVRVAGSSTGGGNPAFNPAAIKSVNIKSDDNYKPSRDTNNPIELTP